MDLDLEGFYHKVPPCGFGVGGFWVKDLNGPILGGFEDCDFGGIEDCYRFNCKLFRPLAFGELYGFFSCDFGVDGFWGFEVDCGIFFGGPRNICGGDGECHLLDLRRTYGTFMGCGIVEGCDASVFTSDGVEGDVGGSGGVLFE